MPGPSISSGYPPAFLEALTRATSGEILTIPHPDPKKLRFRFYNLIRALRREGKGELCEGLTLLVRDDPPRLEIIPVSSTDDAKFLEAALGSKPPEENLDDALARILGKSEK